MAVRGLEDLRRRFRELPGVVQLAVKQEMERIAIGYVAQMKRLAPKQSGALIQSIGYTWGAPPDGSIAVGTVEGNDQAITIYAGNSQTLVYNARGVAFQNAKIQEFGTKDDRVPATPYFFPVLRAGNRSVNRKLGAAARKAAKQLWGS